jgi:hypothetical protein
MITSEPTYGEGYEVGHGDGVEIGRAQARGQIHAGLIARAKLHDANAAKHGPDSDMGAVYGSTAKFLRDLAAELRAGEL